MIQEVSSQNNHQPLDETSSFFIDLANRPYDSNIPQTNIQIQLNIDTQLLQSNQQLLKEYAFRLSLSAQNKQLQQQSRKYMELIKLKNQLQIEKDFVQQYNRQSQKNDQKLNQNQINHQIILSNFDQSNNGLLKELPNDIDTFSQFKQIVTSLKYKKQIAFQKMLNADKKNENKFEKLKIYINYLIEQNLKRYFQNQTELNPLISQLQYLRQLISYKVDIYDQNQEKINKIPEQNHEKVNKAQEQDYHQVNKVYEQEQVNKMPKEQIQEQVNEEPVSKDKTKDQDQDQDQLVFKKIAYKQQLILKQKQQIQIVNHLMEEQIKRRIQYNQQMRNKIGQKQDPKTELNKFELKAHELIKSAINIKIQQINDQSNRKQSQKKLILQKRLQKVQYLIKLKQISVKQLQSRYEQCQNIFKHKKQNIHKQQQIQSFQNKHKNSQIVKNNITKKQNYYAALNNANKESEVNFSQPQLSLNPSYSGLSFLTKNAFVGNSKNNKKIWTIITKPQFIIQFIFYSWIIVLIYQALGISLNQKIISIPQN